MDPNLTLAHITHNTAVVLLYQAMAYPSPVWQSTSMKLPSASSAETCIAAAVEVSKIADHYLRNSPFLANHQMAFCLFVCGRMLLANAAYFQTSLSPSFDSIVLSLGEMAARWDGKPAGTGSWRSSSSSSLAAKFASRLQEARELGSTTCDIRQAAYSTQGDMTSSDNYGGEQADDQGADIQAHLERESLTRDIRRAEQGLSPGQASLSAQTDGPASSENLTLAFPPLPQALQGYMQSGMQTRSLVRAPVDDTATGYFPDTTAAGVDEQPPLDQDLDDIYSYLNGGALPAQRISQYCE